MTDDDAPGETPGTTDDSTDDLDHLRDDVRRSARRTLDRECPEDDCDATEHALFQQYPAVLTTGAWGKYLNPVYRCQGCETAHTLLCYETDQDADRPEWGAYPPEQADSEAGEGLDA
ncbi:ORF 53 [Haloarcula hispanica virus SH1]|uniref:ORF 53 n=1 Tax=Haloarcula hispanica SH1 virus TaxID=326574 RepID=Q4KPD4_9VIRU|nr:ORF 53 [Haloarcula hispanica virus SH1]AAY24979.1 ORF 53 [Haloarcula hispanica virus SH1]